jgi:hypothetical protein
VKSILIQLISVFVSCSVFAADGGAGGAAGGAGADGDDKLVPHPQVGAFVGRILPHGLDNNDEIFSVWGLRYSHPYGKNNAYIDGGTVMGNSAGIKWQSGFLSLSMHFPIETLIGHAGIGLDMTRYETETTPSKNIGGAHFVGGIMSKIGGNTFVRFDMKLNSKPGTSLFLGIGLVIEFDGKGGGDSGGGGAE